MSHHPHRSKLSAAISLLLAGSATFAPITTYAQLDGLSALLAPSGDNTETSILAPLTEPVGDAISPLINSIDLGLDPLTDVIDDQLLEPVLDAVSPLTEPLLDGLDPVTSVVDGITADLTGGSLEDALTNSDDNTTDGNGAVNDLLGGESENTASGTETGEASAIEPLSGPLGEALAPLVEAVDTGLDPLTDTVDDQLGVALLDALAPVTEPVLDALQPATDPVDGILTSVTGGSLEDALTNTDDNTADGDGIVNDLLGDASSGDSGSSSGSDFGLPGLGDSGSTEPSGPSAGEPELSPLEPITAPLGDGLATLIDAVDLGLDPLTDVVDDSVLEPVLDGLSPLTDPLLSGLELVTDPVDGIVLDLTGGSLEDALTNNDDNTTDGNGAVNDLLGGDSENSASGTEAGEYSALQPITGPLGESLAPLVDALDTTLDPLTDAVDDQLGVALLDGLAPVTQPVLDTLEPVTDPVDGVLADVTGGSLEDALTNNDDNSGDGDGIVNDLLGGEQVANSGTEEGELSPLPGITEPLGESLAPLVDTLDTALDPLTDTIDDQIGVMLLDGLSPVTETLLDTLEPATDPVDGLLADVTGGSLEDALTNNDDNSGDGDGIVNDLLGGASSDGSGTEAGETSPLENVTDPLGEVLAPVIDAVDIGLAPVTDAVDDQLGEPLLDALAPAVDPLLDTLEPVTDPVDGLISDLTGGSVEDALTNNDDNTADGNGLINDLLGGGDSEATGSEGDSLLGIITGPLGDGLTPLVDALDEGLDPTTDPIDQVLEPILGTLEPATGPILAGLTPVTTPVDDIISDVTGGNLTDGLSTSDSESGDGSGAVNDILGGSGISNPNVDNADEQPALIALADPLFSATQSCGDTDGDGVCDAQDRCADTPAGAAVLNNGCHLDDLSPLQLEGVFFEYDSDVLTADSIVVLDSAVNVINQSHAARLEIGGHTDARGTDAYNLTLSEKRAMTVTRYLIDHGVDGSRLDVRGYGESQPVSDNDTESGMAQNRRVEVKVVE